MAILKLQVYIELDTDKTESEAVQAVKKGIYWGLDVKNVCEPKKVKSISII